MDFPAYVPAAVRTHLINILEGESLRGIPGYSGLLSEANQRLEAIEESLERKVICGEVEDLPDLRRQKVEASSHRDMLAGDVDCLLRLAHDPRMRDSFALLTREFDDDDQWRSFTYAAWAARVDFEKFRNRLRRAAELKGEIANAAETLAKLIHHFSETGVMGPGEFYSIPELLRKTDNHDMDGHNLHMWQTMRRHILGERPEYDLPARVVTLRSDDESTSGIQVGTFLDDGVDDITPEQKSRNLLSYAWGTAPDLSALLDTVAKAAKGFKPSESGMIGAAIETRQRSVKTEYLRAFGNLLTDVHGFALTKPIMQAMAIVANVVINLPDVDVTYDDVRKALAKAGRERLENSGEK
jgi:hypothetical protein